MRLNKGDRVRYDDNGRLMGTVTKIDETQAFVTFDEEDTIGAFEREDDSRISLITARPDEGSEDVADEALKAISADLYQIKKALFAINETLGQISNLLAR